MILYEYPFNERIRTYLRLEHLLLRLQDLLERSDAVDHQYALHTLFETVDVASRSDLKTDFLTDLDRQRHLLESYRSYPDVDLFKLDRMCSRIEYCADALRKMPNKPGQKILDNEWLSSIRNRMSISGGTCNFDLPQYHNWLHQPSAKRLRDLENWAGNLIPIAEAVFLILKLIRDTGTSHRVAAPRGQFQQNLPGSHSFYLLRFWVNPKDNVTPEVGVNRLIVSIRLMELNSEGKSIRTNNDLSLEVAICGL